MKKGHVPLPEYDLEFLKKIPLTLTTVTFRRDSMDKASLFLI